MDDLTGSRSHYRVLPGCRVNGKDFWLSSSLSQNDSRPKGTKDLGFPSPLFKIEIVLWSSKSNR